MHDQRWSQVKLATLPYGRTPWTIIDRATLHGHRNGPLAAIAKRHTLSAIILSPRPLLPAPPLSPPPANGSSGPRHSLTPVPRPIGCPASLPASCIIPAAHDFSW